MSFAWRKHFLIGVGAGIVLTYLAWGFYSYLLSSTIGRPLLCQAAYSQYHNACVYSRLIPGDQRVTLQINSETVFQAEHLPVSQLNERISWGHDDKMVTFYADGVGERSYDAESGTEARFP